MRDFDNWRWGLNYRFEEISEEFSSFAQVGKLFVKWSRRIDGCKRIPT